MPKVMFGIEEYEVDDGLYRQFLEDVLVNDFDVDEGIDMACDTDKELRSLSDYIKYRLIEVDPGYGPEMPREG